jgi:hypothetical protein
MEIKARSIAWAGTLACTLLVVAANSIIAAMVGFDLSSLLIKVIFPVGLMVLGAIAMSGFVFTAKRTQLAVNRVDLAFLLAISASLMFLIYGGEYLFFQHATDQTFSKFLVFRITRARYEISGPGMSPNAPATLIGDAGWALMLVKTGCMLAIGRVAWSMAKPDTSTWQV